MSDCLCQGTSLVRNLARKETPRRRQGQTCQTSCPCRSKLRADVQRCGITGRSRKASEHCQHTFNGQDRKEMVARCELRSLRSLEYTIRQATHVRYGALHHDSMRSPTVDGDISRTEGAACETCYRRAVMPEMRVSSITHSPSQMPLGK